MLRFLPVTNDADAARLTLGLAAVSSDGRASWDEADRFNVDDCDDCDLDLVVLELFDFEDLDEDLDDEAAMNLVASAERVAASEVEAIGVGGALLDGPRAGLVGFLTLPAGAVVGYGALFSLSLNERDVEIEGAGRGEVTVSRSSEVAVNSAALTEVLDGASGSSR